MPNTTRLVSSLLTPVGCALLLTLVDCAARPATGAPSPGATPVAGAIPVKDGCVGVIQTPAGARVLPDAVPAFATPGAGRGYLCDGRAFEATRALTVYRVYHSTETPGDGKAHRMGGSWSLDKPGGKAAEYRVDNAICPVWNDLTRLVVCTLRPGTRFYVGTGQSVSPEVCGGAGAPGFAASATNQVLIPGSGPKHDVYPFGESDCHDEALTWEAP